jgi:hypothetical protein
MRRRGTKKLRRAKSESQNVSTTVRMGALCARAPRQEGQLLRTALLRAVGAAGRRCARRSLRVAGGRGGKALLAQGGRRSAAAGSRSCSGRVDCTDPAGWGGAPGHPRGSREAGVRSVTARADSVEGRVRGAAAEASGRSLRDGELRRRRGARQRAWRDCGSSRRQWRTLADARQPA